MIEQFSLKAESLFLVAIYFRLNNSPSSRFSRPWSFLLKKASSLLLVPSVSFEAGAEVKSPSSLRSSSSRFVSSWESGTALRTSGPAGWL